MTTVTSRSAAETEELGGLLARGLEPGSLVLVSGEMGAGKSTFVRGACRALGITEAITSPTFTIGRRYEGHGVAVSHLDLYRLEGGLGDEVPGLLDEYLTPDAIAFVEWPGLGEGDLPEPAATVTIRHEGGDTREVEVELRVAAQ